VRKRKVKRETYKRFIEGRNPVLEALLAGTKIGHIWIADGVIKNGKINQILYLSGEKQIPVKRTSRRFLDKVSRTHLHQGVVAFALPLPSISLKQLLEQRRDEVCFLLLTEVLDEQNLGAILRTAEVVGVTAVIIPKGAKGITPVVDRASMGAVEYLPVIKENLFSALKILKRNGVRIIGAEAKAGKSLFQTNLVGSVAFVVGGEDKGLTGPIKQACDFLVSIPMRGKVSSLNMSVACAIFLYEKLRQEEVKSDD